MSFPLDFISYFCFSIKAVLFCLYHPLTPSWLSIVPSVSLSPSFFPHIYTSLVSLPLVVLSRQQRRVQLMRIRQREERLKKEKENKKKKKRQTQKTSHKQKAHTHHHHHQQYHHPAASHPHHQAQSSQPPKVPPPQTEPGYHRKVNPKRRFDGDVLSPVRCRSLFILKMKWSWDSCSIGQNLMLSKNISRNNKKKFSSNISGFIMSFTSVCSIWNWSQLA